MQLTYTEFAQVIYHKFITKCEQVGIKTTFFVCLKSITVNKYYVYIELLGFE